jgi:uncharacterized membrane protein
MNGFRFFKVLKVMAIVAIALVVFGFVTMHLWNWLVPAVFGLGMHTISFAQALGLVVLCKILFGGFHRHGGGCHGRREWKHRMMDRWMEMSPEERERFQAGMRGRWGCGFGGKNEPASEQRP